METCDQGQYKCRLVGEFYQRKVPATVMEVITRHGRKLELTPQMILDLPDLEACFSPMEIEHVKRVHYWDCRRYKHAQPINQSQPVTGNVQLRLVKN